MKNDYQTSTVDGVEGFQKMYAEKEEIDAYESEDTSEYNEDYEDDCNCSDPGCPCGGVKRGGV